jgi:broad specificity phosphatase PhoE
VTRLYLIRHGEPAGTWTDSPDPGLSTLGHEQAKAAAERLRAFASLDIVTSPLRRAQETATPFAQMRGVSAKIVRAVAEIPTPSEVALEHRGDWLRAVMAGKWSDAERPLQDWRAQVIEYLLRLPRDTAVFSHYVAINVAAGAARHDDRVTVFAPTHASITILDATPRGLEEVELGRAGETTVR